MSLVALNILGLAYCPGFSSVRADLVTIGLVLVVIHSMYSTYYYYGSSNIPILSKWHKIMAQIGDADPKKRGSAIKKISLIAGALGEIAVAFAAWDYFTVFMAGLLIIHLGIIHFYLMEIDQKIVLQVRPFALITFVFAGLGVANLVYLDKF